MISPSEQRKVGRTHGLGTLLFLSSTSPDQRPLREAAGDSGRLKELWDEAEAFIAEVPE